jgi:transcriptional regulator with XRE-family HTH domain
VHMPRVTRSHAVADRPLARRIGAVIRAERLRAHMTQSQLADGRYTKAYVSALENGLAKPSLAALNFLAEKLQVPVTKLMAAGEPAWTRLDADLHLAAGDWQQAVDAFQVLLDANPSERTRPELLRAIAEGYYRLEQGADCVRTAAEATDLFRRQGRNAEAAWSTYWEAGGLYELEQGDGARELLVRLLDEIAQGLSVDPELAMRIPIALAMIESRDDQPERALGYLEQARSMVGMLDDRRRATFLYSLALSYHELGDLEAALTTGSQSLTHFRAAEADREVASIENELALVFLALGRVKRAIEHVAAARTGFERLENQRSLAHVLDTEARIELARGDVEQAATLALEARRLADETENRKASISASLTLARARRAQGDLASASTTLDDAAVVARTHGRRGQLQAVLGEWAEVKAEQGDLRGAFDLSQEALRAGRHTPPSANGRTAEESVETVSPR